MTVNSSNPWKDERNHILSALKETKWVLSGPTGAAARLGLNRSALYSRMKKVGIVLVAIVGFSVTFHEYANRRFSEIGVFSAKSNNRIARPTETALDCGA